MKERPVACSACAVVSIESDRIPGFPTGGKACLVSPFDNILLRFLEGGAFLFLLRHDHVVIDLPKILHLLAIWDSMH